MLTRGWLDKMPPPIVGGVPAIFNNDQGCQFTSDAFVAALESRDRKVTLNRQSFPTTAAAKKLVFMALQNISKKWTMTIR